MSEDFTGGWFGSSSIIAPPLSLLDPRSSGKNKATGTVLKMAQTNPVIQSPRSEEMKNKRSETHPVSDNRAPLRDYPSGPAGGSPGVSAILSCKFTL